MIPKRIHYCWFGEKPLPKIANKCIASWKKYCPDYEITEWNENNFDVNCCDYTREAYQAKQYAFVSDVARLHALINYGGIYMDIDHEILKPIDSFLEYEAFCGFATEEDIGFGILGCTKNAEIFKEFLSVYNNIHFVKQDGKNDITIVNVRFQAFCEKYGFVNNNTFQKIGSLSVFPSEYFYAKSFRTQKTKITKNTYSIHHCYGSWNTPKVRIQNFLLKVFGRNITDKIVKLKKKIIG